MKVLKRATNNTENLLHVTNHQQLTVGQGERQPVDSESRLARMLLITRLLNLHRSMNHICKITYLTL